MNWTVAKSTDDKTEIQKSVDNEPNCPQEVCDAVEDILEAISGDKKISFSCSGSHSGGEISSVGITFNVIVI